MKKNYFLFGSRHVPTPGQGAEGSDQWVTGAEISLKQETHHTNDKMNMILAMTYI